jgi:hypothetical protein
VRLTDERITFLSHHIVRVLTRERMISGDESALSVLAKKTIINFLKNEALIDERVRAKIMSIRRNIPEGSREWEVMYEQFYGEEMNKLK